MPDIRSAKILIADSIPSFRQGLSAALVEIGSNAPREMDIFPRPLHSSWDVVIFDLDSLTDVDEIADFPGIMVAVASGLDPEQNHAVNLPRSHKVNALEKIHTVVHREERPSLVAEAVRFSLAGYSVVPTDAKTLVAGDIPEHCQTLLSALVSGRRLSDIAYDLGYSRRELHRRIHALCTVLGVENRIQAIAMGALIGAVTSDEILVMRETTRSGN